MNKVVTKSPIKIMTIVGTRPELIKLSRIIPLLDEHTNHTLVHTGQNFSPELSDVFLVNYDSENLITVCLFLV